jgi:hypothetical protein
MRDQEVIDSELRLLGTRAVTASSTSHRCSGLAADCGHVARLGPSARRRVPLPRIHDAKLFR